MRKLQLASLALSSKVELDLFAHPRYDIQVGVIESFIQSLNQGGSVVTLENGKIECIIPDTLPDPIETQQSIPTILELIKSLPCLYQIYDGKYWAYQFCQSKELVQFHPLSENEQPTKETRYILGRYSNPKSELKSDIIDGKKVSYLEQVWGNGSICEINGKERKVVIEFYCAKNEGIESVRETNTCEYKLVVHTPRLCSAFVDQDDLKEPTIMCKSADDIQVQFKDNIVVPLRKEYSSPAKSVVTTNALAKAVDSVLDALKKNNAKGIPKDVEVTYLYLNEQEQLDVDKIMKLLRPEAAKEESDINQVQDSKDISKVIDTLNEDISKLQLLIDKYDEDAEENKAEDKL